MIATLVFAEQTITFLIYINDSSDNLITNPKLFADYASLFAIVHDPNATANDLNNDLAK